MVCALQILAEEVRAAQDDYADQGFVYVSYMRNVEPRSCYSHLGKWATDHHISSAPVLASYDDLRPQFAPTATYPRSYDRPQLRVIEDNIFPQNDETIREKLKKHINQYAITFGVEYVRR